MQRGQRFFVPFFIDVSPLKMKRGEDQKIFAPLTDSVVKFSQTPSALPVKDQAATAKTESFAFTSFTLITSVVSRVVDSPICSPVETMTGPSDTVFFASTLPSSSKSFSKLRAKLANTLALLMQTVVGGPGGSRTRVQNNFQLHVQRLSSLTTIFMHGKA